MNFGEEKNVMEFLIKRLAKKILLGLLIFSFILPLFADARGSSVRVRGYTRKDGTYVQPHYRSAPDGNPYNNWSFPGNTNPYTGETASGNPDTYIQNYYDRNGNPSYSLPSYPISSPIPTPLPSYLSPTYSVGTNGYPSYSAPPTQSSIGLPKQNIYRRSKQAVDLQTGCNSSGLNQIEIPDCFHYALNKNNFDWEVIDYQMPQPQVVSQPSIISTPPQIASAANAITIQKEQSLIAALQAQITALQMQLNALLRR